MSLLEWNELNYFRDSLKETELIKIELFFELLWIVSNYSKLFWTALNHSKLFRIVLKKIIWFENVYEKKMFFFHP